MATALPSLLLQGTPIVTERLCPIAESHMTLLVLQYLKGQQFRKSYEALLAESASTTGPLVEQYLTPFRIPTHQPKSLRAILSEYLALKEEALARHQLFAHPSSTLAPHTIRTFAAIAELVADYTTYRQLQQPSPRPQETIGADPSPSVFSQSHEAHPTPSPSHSTARRSPLTSPASPQTSPQAQALALPRPNILPESVPGPSSSSPSSGSGRRKSPFPKRRIPVPTAAPGPELVSRRLASEVNCRLPSGDIRQLDSIDVEEQLDDIVTNLTEDPLFREQLFNSVLEFSGRAPSRRFSTLSPHVPPLDPLEMDFSLPSHPPHATPLGQKRARPSETPEDSAPTKKRYPLPSSPPADPMPLDLSAQQENPDAPALSSDFDIDSFLDSEQYRSLTHEEQEEPPPE